MSMVSILPKLPRLPVTVPPHVKQTPTQPRNTESHNGYVQNRITCTLRLTNTKKETLAFTGLYRDSFLTPKLRQVVTRDTITVDKARNVFGERAYQGPNNHTLPEIARPIAKPFSFY